MTSLLTDAELRMRYTPVQTMFAQVIERMDETVHNLATNQKQKSRVDNSQTQQIMDLENHLSALRHDFDALKRECDKQEYDQTNLQRQVQQLLNDNKQLERKVQQLERICK